MTKHQFGLHDGKYQDTSTRLYRVGRRGRSFTKLSKRTVANEKSLQSLMERHLLALLDVHFLATEYATGVRHRGRIDTLGIDVDGSPVVIEYKRSASVSLISQGLFYLDWLDDLRGEFRLLVQERLGPAAVKVSWRAP